MFEFVFSTDNFFNTLAKHLKDNQYTSIPSSVLIDALSTVTLSVVDETKWANELLICEQIQVDNLNSSAFVDSWTLQAGFPYINLTYNGETNSYTVTQERFFSSGRVESNS